MEKTYILRVRIGDNIKEYIFYAEKEINKVVNFLEEKNIDFEVIDD